MKKELRKKSVRPVLKSMPTPKPAPINRALLREHLEAYKVSNLEKERERIKKVRQRTPEQAFQTFLDLWEFGQRFGGKDTFPAKEKVESINRYYANYCKYMERRIELGKESPETAERWRKVVAWHNSQEQE